MIKKLLIQLLKSFDWGSALACRLTALTGKARIPTHPKHLVDFGQLYYLRWLKKPDRVLDLGCHAGEHAIKAARFVRKVVGIDKDRELIARAKSETERQHIRNVSFQIGNLEKKLPFPENSFNKIFLFAVLEHIRDEGQLLDEIKRVLSKRGVLFVSVPNRDTQWKKIQRSVGLAGLADPDHKREYSQKEIVAKLKAHQFSTIKLQPGGLDTPLSGLIDLVGGISLSAYQQLMRWKAQQGRKHPKNTVGFLIIAKNEK